MSLLLRNLRELVSRQELEVCVTNPNLLRANNYALRGRPRCVCEDFERDGNLIGGSRGVEIANAVLRWATDAEASR